MKQHLYLFDLSKVYHAAAKSSKIDPQAPVCTVVSIQLYAALRQPKIIRKII